MATQGSWRGVYGIDGYSLAQGASSLPSYATTAPRGHSNWTWSASTADTRALQKPAPAADRLAAVWYGNTFTVDVSVGSTERRVSLYMTDWENAGRSQKIEVLDAATGAVLDTRTVSGFGGGVWLSWDLAGAVQFRVTKISGINAVLNGVFFGSQPASSTSASYVGTDVATQGIVAWGVRHRRLLPGSGSVESALLRDHRATGPFELDVVGIDGGHPRLAEAGAGG